VYGVCVVLPSAFLEPGVVEAYLAPRTGSLDVGRWPAGTDGTAESLAAAFAGATFASAARPDITRYKYGKLLSNLGNAVEVVIGPGERGADIARLAREEGEACLRAAGIEAVGGVGMPSRIRPIRGRERGGGSSYQSLLRGTGTIEADYLNGEIVLLGREHGVPTPVNDLLRRLANRMAREGLRPGLMTPEEFLAGLGSGAG
jgi:2-dehydropantoate 2-reductase